MHNSQVIFSKIFTPCGNLRETAETQTLADSAETQQTYGKKYQLIAQNKRRFTAVYKAGYAIGKVTERRTEGTLKNSKRQIKHLKCRFSDLPQPHSAGAHCACGIGTPDYRKFKRFRRRRGNGCRINSFCRFHPDKKRQQNQYYTQFSHNSPAYLVYPHIRRQCFSNLFTLQ